MKNTKKKKLEAMGWRVGGPTEFLGLSQEEAAYIELKLTLSKSLQQLRKTRKLTQIDLAKRLKSSQSRVAKMEAGDNSVSIDLILRSLFALGATRKKVAGILAA